MSTKTKTPSRTSIRSPKPYEVEDESDLFAPLPEPRPVKETAKERHARKSPSHAQTILAFLRSHIGVSFSKLELRRATNVEVENVDGRIGDLQRAGWQILGAEDLSTGEDGTQLYMLTSTTRGAPRRKGYGYTVRSDSYDGRRVVMEKNHDNIYNDAELALLGRYLEAAVGHWEARVGRRS